MEARTMSLPPAASHDDAERCFFAIELSKKTIRDAGGFLAGQFVSLLTFIFNVLL
jgi:hypothetical protein